ncbi:hypothetical protein [Aeromonas hydrophila]|uniref:hypothetical protein n=1 Tax=Aeromonas hydrophila TaxID=644 RepID=UPI00207CD24A|nr:hypothetical protein [Aeromonas hydrophila]MCO4211123.1 hypothetical protein [Aeromonas hydrophila]HDX8445102.1 hypothetical protein [Aeromonas hydrophila]HDX8635971.1 hypothetical protein [Aeromonas hydrophila]
MINYKRPKKPHGFPPKKIILLLQRIATKASSGDELSSSEFKSYWGDYKDDFSKCQGEGKCGYCETRITAASYGGVDHIRPKTEVIYLKDKIKPTGQDRIREEDGKLKPGYWRLAYNWYNWIFVCDICNSSWKKNQFPTTPKNNAIDRYTYRTEKRLLLNPFIDAKIGTNFKYDYNGSISGITPEGVATVHVCGLDRINLIAERKIVSEQVYRHINDIKGARATNCQILIAACLRNLYCLSQDKMQYAGMIRYFVNKEQNVIGVNWATLRDMAENGDLNP